MPIVPNLLIAGVTKSGTTSLFTYLNDHPDICGSTVKEISHFVTVRFREPEKPIEEYSKYFKHYSDELYRLEASPAYFLGGRELAEKVNNSLPDVRVIIILREPVGRCLSHFKFSKNMLWLPKEMKLDEYIERCINTPYETFKNRGSYVYYGLASGIYANYLDAWIETFGERLHICFFEDMYKDSRDFTQQICDWLGIDRGFYDNYDFVVENKGTNFNNPIMQKMALKLNKLFEGFFRKNIATKRMLRSMYYAINGVANKPNKDVIDKKEIAQIEQYYVPHNQRLRDMLDGIGVDNLPRWLRMGD
jgi:hypothetical protein